MPPSAGSSVSPEPSSFQLNPGDRVGNYVIREQIGEGGFAISPAYFDLHECLVWRRAPDMHV